MKKHLLLPGLVLALLTQLKAQTLLTTQHTDIGLGEGTELELHWHDEDTPAEYEPEEAIAYVDPAYSLNLRPSGSQWDFLGVSSGENIYILPQTQDSNLLFLGVGAEDIDPGTWSAWNPNDSRGADSEEIWLRLSLVSVSGPGEFSVWQNGSFGSPVVFMSTSETPAEGNHLYVIEGGHSHYSWGFSELGTYEVTFEVSAWDGTAFQTQQGTFTFSSVPEPSTYALAGLSLLVLFFSRKKAGRTANT